MRSRYADKQFGLVFGAGTSLQLGFPNWKDLLNNIASSCTSLNSSNVPSQPSLAQCLFQAFLNRYMDNKNIELHPTKEQNAEIKSRWTKLVIEKLYENVPEHIDQLQKKSNYLIKFLPIIKNTTLTVNYNFDDSIQRLLNAYRTDDEKKRGSSYRTDWRADPQIYSQHAVIYHPNGYLPKPSHKCGKPSDSIILLDDAFGDQLIQSMAGKYTYLVNHYAQNTCLLVGLSLDDTTLQNILRRNAVTHPGHVHYYVRYMKKGESLSEKEETTITHANFETYNLVTLFLGDDEINLIAELIHMDEKDFADLCDEVGARQKYVYYLTGCVAAGKSTSVSYFRSLSIHDEWIEEMPDDMDKDPSLAKASNIEKIDKFVAEQWKKKNAVLLKSNGIIIVDRCQLDAFGFTKRDKWKDKAQFLYNIIFPDCSTYKFQRGMIIMLINTPEELEARAVANLRGTNKDLLRQQQELLLECYKKRNGIIHIDCSGMTKADVAKLISRIIHMKEYVEFDSHQYLMDLKKGE